MIVLDENIPLDQIVLLNARHFHVRQIGHEIGHKGLRDGEIVPLLRTLRRPTLLTLDAGFFEKRLCHARYCIVYLNILRVEVATYVRRFLRHPEFDTQSKRMGSVVKASPTGLLVWRVRSQNAVRLPWPETRSSHA